MTQFQHSLGPHHDLRRRLQHIIGQRGTGLHSTIMKWARKMAHGGRAVDQTLSELGQVFALRAHCVRTACAEARILTQEYLSPVY